MNKMTNVQKWEVAEKAWNDAIADLDEEYGFCKYYGFSATIENPDLYDDEDELYDVFYNDSYHFNEPDEDMFDEEDEE